MIERTARMAFKDVAGKKANLTIRMLSKMF